MTQWVADNDVMHLYSSAASYTIYEVWPCVRRPITFKLNSSHMTYVNIIHTKGTPACQNGWRSGSTGMTEIPHYFLCSVSATAKYLINGHLCTDGVLSSFVKVSSHFLDHELILGGVQRIMHTCPLADLHNKRRRGVKCASM